MQFQIEMRSLRPDNYSSLFSLGLRAKQMLSGRSMCFPQHGGKYIRDYPRHTVTDFSAISFVFVCWPSCLLTLEKWSLFANIGGDRFSTFSMIITIVVSVGIMIKMTWKRSSAACKGQLKQGGIWESSTWERGISRNRHHHHECLPPLLMTRQLEELLSIIHVKKKHSLKILSFHMLCLTTLNLNSNCSS